MPDFIEMYKSYQRIWGNLIAQKVKFESIFGKKSISKKIWLIIRKCKTLNGFAAHKKYKEYNELIQKIPYGTTKYCSQLTVMDNGPVEHVPINVFCEMTLMTFENFEFYAVKNYDLILRSVYGDYMQLPPVNQRIPHQDHIKFYWI